MKKLSTKTSRFKNGTSRSAVEKGRNQRRHSSAVSAESVTPQREKKETKRRASTNSSVFSRLSAGLPARNTHCKSITNSGSTPTGVKSNAKMREANATGKATKRTDGYIKVDRFRKNRVERHHKHDCAVSTFEQITSKMEEERKNSQVSSEFAEGSTLATRHASAPATSEAAARAADLFDNLEQREYYGRSLRKLPVMDTTSNKQKETSNMITRIRHQREKRKAALEKVAKSIENGLESFQPQSQLDHTNNEQTRATTSIAIESEVPSSDSFPTSNQRISAARRRKRELESRLAETMRCTNSTTTASLTSDSSKGATSLTSDSSKGTTSLTSDSSKGTTSLISDSSKGTSDEVTILPSFPEDDFIGFGVARKKSVAEGIMFRDSVDRSLKTERNSDTGFLGLHWDISDHMKEPQVKRTEKSNETANDLKGMPDIGWLTLEPIPVKIMH